MKQNYQPNNYNKTLHFIHDIYIYKQPTSIKNAKYRFVSHQLQITCFQPCSFATGSGDRSNIKRPSKSITLKCLVET